MSAGTRSASKDQCDENLSSLLIVSLGKTMNKVSLLLRDGQVVEPGGLYVPVVQFKVRRISRA